MKKIFFVFLVSSFCAFNAFASQAALDFLNHLKTWGASSDAGLGHIFYSLDTLNCSEKKSTDCNGNPTYSCDAMTSNDSSGKPLTATGDMAKSLYMTLAKSTTTKPSCDDQGLCTFYATDIQCRQANADNWDPGTAPSEADRTDCHFSLQIEL